MRNFVFLGPTIFDHLRGEGVWVIWFGLEFLDNYGKLSTYPSPKPTLALITHLGRMLAEGGTRASYSETSCDFVF